MQLDIPRSSTLVAYGLSRKRQISRRTRAMVHTNGNKIALAMIFRRRSFRFSEQICRFDTATITMVK
jgi:hypothetical protein